MQFIILIKAEFKQLCGTYCFDGGTKDWKIITEKEHSKDNTPNHTING